MKKSFLFAAAALLTLSACTSEDVLKESNLTNAIGFKNVVNKQSRSNAAEITASTLKHFSVFGYYTNPNTPTQAVLVFNDELVSKVESQDPDKEVNTASWNYSNTRFWVPNANYCFYAYSCGDVKLNNTKGKFAMDVSKNQQNDRILKIIDYICDETHQHDLLYAYKENVEAKADKNDAVAFKFNHILSKINTKFTSEFAPQYTVEIKNIVASNIRNKGDYDFKKNGWSNQERVKIDGEDPYVILHGEEAIEARKGGTIYDINNEVKEVIEAKAAVSKYAFVLPHAYKEAEVTLSFEITIKTDGKTVLSRVLSGSWKPTWVEGHAYTYNIQITGDATNLKPIVFTTETDPITGWTSGETPTDIVFSAN